jgi:hypothetical protein
MNGSARWVEALAAKGRVIKDSGDRTSAELFVIHVMHLQPEPAWIGPFILGENVQAVGQVKLQLAAHRSDPAQPGSRPLHRGWAPARVRRRRCRARR